MKVENKNKFAIYLGVLIVAIFLLNYVSRNFYGRFDLTDTQMFTISESSKTVLENIDDLLIMRAYFSEDLGSELGNNKRYLQDLLEEYRAVNNEYIDFEFFTSNDAEEFKTEAQKSGIQPVQLNVIENDKMEIKQVFMGMVIMYGDKKESIPVIQTTTGLEYTITSAIKKLINVNKETIGLASLGAPNPQSNNQSISELLRQTYDVQPVNLDSPVSPAIGALILSDVTDSLSEGQYSNLDNYLAMGGNLFLAQNRIKTDIQTQSAEPLPTNLFSLLEHYGVSINENLILDKNCGQVTISQNRGFFRMNSAKDYPFFPKITDFSEEQIVVNGLEMIQVLFPSEVDAFIDTTGQNTGSFTPLFITSNQSTAMEEFYNLSPIDNPSFNSLNEGPFNVAALATQQNNESGLISQIIVVADSRFLSDDGGGRMPENLTFALNSVDFLIGDSDLIALRSREITTRPLNADAQEAGVKSFWKKLNYFLPAFLILLFAFFKARKEKARTHKLEYMYE
jgi:gliding-associated putative ABC transporter substrate-binding component GldG